MGAEWDKLDAGLPQENVWKSRRGQGGSGLSEGGFKESNGYANRKTPSYSGRPTPFKRCTKCGKRQFSGSPCKCEKPEWVLEYPEGAPSSSIRMQRWHEAWAREAFRVLKPGGHMLAAGGTRTFHRLVCAVEDAGFEIRDTVSHFYGSGFPKSKSMREIGRPELGSALKPAHEPWTLARKPLAESSIARNVLEHGTGALSVYGCRVEGVPEMPGTTPPTTNGNGKTHGAMTRASYEQPSGRFPANLLFSHHPDCVRIGERRVKPVQKAAGSVGFAADREDGYAKGTGREYPNGMETVAEYRCVPGCPVAELDRQSGAVRSSGHYRKGANGVGSKDGPASIPIDGLSSSAYADSGGASRFFKVFEPDIGAGFKYCPKSSRSERNAGLEGMPEHPAHKVDGGDFRPEGRSLTSKGLTHQNTHPTVKPIMLLRYLAKLITPPGGTILDPFAGSGSTGCAAVLEGFDFIGIERQPEYVEIARRRIEHWSLPEEERTFQEPGKSKRVVRKVEDTAATEPEHEDLTLFPEFT